MSESRSEPKGGRRWDFPAQRQAKSHVRFLGLKAGSPAPPAADSCFCLNPQASERGAALATVRSSPGPAARVGLGPRSWVGPGERGSHRGCPRTHPDPSYCPSRAALGGHQFLGGQSRTGRGWALWEAGRLTRTVQSVLGPAPRGRRD